VRVYLPATLPTLARWLAAGEADVAGDLGYSVTPTLRESYYDADLDELEHAAQIAAAVGSLERLAADPAAARRRVVVAADVPDVAVIAAPGVGRAAVRLAGAVPVSAWASALVDDGDAAAVVGEAAASVAAAAAGDDDAQFAVDEAEAHELGWYAVQELPHLVDGA
jgi:hypothetical protein